MGVRIVYGPMELGHLALGYFSALAVSKLTKKDFNVPLALLFSIAPDIDFFIPYTYHRGITHSIFWVLILLAPIIWKFQQGLPYLASLASHSLIGDLLLGPQYQILWPLSDFYYGGLNLISQSTLRTIEIFLLLLMIILIYKSTNSSNLRA